MALRLEKILAIEYLSKAGMSIRAIASAVDASPTTVQAVLATEPDEDGCIPVRQTTGLDGRVRLSRRVDTSERDARIRELRTGGASIRAIATEVGCSTGTVSRVASSPKRPAT